MTFEEWEFKNVRKLMALDTRASMKAAWNAAWNAALDEGMESIEMARTFVDSDVFFLCKDLLRQTKAPAHE